VVIRRLGPGDESVVAVLAQDDVDFDLDDSHGPRRPLPPDAARAHLADPRVLHWAAWVGSEVVGFIFCLVLPMRKQPAREVLLYEIGVRSARRRRGVGRQLVSVMTDWMRAEGVVTAWVLADNPDAERFYEACGFGPGSGAATYLELILPASCRIREQPRVDGLPRRT
jgi:GNAT superfamily N-acetyltransferase